jgi:hypothetical protein
MTEASYQRLHNRITALEHELGQQIARSRELARRLRELRDAHQALVLQAGLLGLEVVVKPQVVREARTVLRRARQSPSR